MSFSRLSPNMLSACFGVISGRFIAQKLSHFVSTWDKSKKRNAENKGFILVPTCPIILRFFSVTLRSGWWSEIFKHQMRLGSHEKHGQESRDSEAQAPNPFYTMLRCSNNIL
jgi:hypothetical protein